MSKKLRTGSIGLFNGKQIILDEYEMDYWDTHILPNNLIILADLRTTNREPFPNQPIQ